MKRVSKFNVRVVKQGERYGLLDCLTHDDSRPLVEFYDSRFTNAPEFAARGQFVSRYYLETLQEDSAKLRESGLCLDGGNREVWSLTGAEFAESLAYAIREAFDPATLWPDVSSSRGAPMGRASDTLAQVQGFDVLLYRVPMVDSCYDPGGAYWGAGDSAVGFMFAWYCPESDSRGYFRADGFEHAAKTIRQAGGIVDESTAALDSFIGGYIEALLFTDNAPRVYREEWESQSEEEQGEREGSFPDGCDESDIAPASLETIRTDCAAFVAKAADILPHALTRGYTIEQAGRDFWLTRNGHGAGFWDREELDFRLPGHAESIGDELSAIARRSGSVDSYWGDDSQIHL